MYQIDADGAIDERVIDYVPIIANAFEMRWKLFGIEIRELVTNALELGMRVLEVGADLSIAIDRWGGACEAWRKWVSIWLGVSRCYRPLEPDDVCSD